MNPLYLKAETSDNSQDFLSRCLGNIKPTEGSDVRPIFDKIIAKINPTLSEKDLKILKEWLGTQESNLHLFNQVLEENHIKFPPINVETMDLPMFTDYRSALALKLIQAKIHLSQKDTNLATANILEAYKFGRMVRYGERSSILHYMIGTSIEEQSLRWLQNILCTSKLSNDTMQQILFTIQLEKIKDEAFISAIKDEFNNFTIPIIEYYSKQIGPILKQLEINKKSILDEKESINLITKQLHRIVDNANSPWPERDDYVLRDYLQDPGIVAKLEKIENLMFCNGKTKFDINNVEQVTKWKELGKLANGKENILGKYLVSSSTSFESYHKRSVGLRTKVNLTRTLVALIIFNKKYGYYPKRLIELVESGIISQIPLDLFSNRIVNYSFQDKKIWSTGSDGVNNQGEEKNDIPLSCELIKKKPEKAPCN